MKKNLKSASGLKNYYSFKKSNFYKKDEVPKTWGRMSQMPGVLDLVENYGEAKVRS